MKLVGIISWSSDEAIDIFELPPSPSQIGIPNISSIFHHLDILDILDALTEISSDTDGRCAILMLICWWYWYFWHYSQSGANAGAFRRSEDQRRQSIDYLRSLFLDVLASLGSMLESESVLLGASQEKKTEN